MLKPEISSSTEEDLVNESSDDTINSIEFSDLGLPPKMLSGIQEAGFTSPSPIQQMAIPHVLAKKDLIAQAQTGSGKTAAFVIPSLSLLKYDRTVEVLVLVPTRELSLQVVQEFERLGKNLRLNIVNIVGGQSAYRQIEMVNRGAQVVVATPGRLLDHLSSGVLKNFSPSLVILDEADEMLDMGFIEDIRSILSYTSDERQTLLFSATLPRGIVKLSKEVLKNPESIQLATNDQKNKDIEQVLFLIRQKEREQALIRLIDSENPEKAVVFCRTKKETVDLCDFLNKKGYKAQPLHGDMSQNERTRAVKDIKNGYVSILVATDVASRGLDIKDLSHVFNYQLPESRDRYTHRIGRTGRAGSKGRAISLATPSELEFLSYLKDREKTNYQFGCLPSKSEIQSKVNASIFEEVSETSVNDDVKEICDKFVTEEDRQQFLYKFYAFLRKGKNVSGPDYLGFSIDESLKLHTKVSRKPDRGGSGRGRSFGGGRGRRSGGGGGGRGGRSGSGGGFRSEGRGEGRGSYRGGNASGGSYSKDSRRSGGGSGRSSGKVYSMKNS